MVLFVFFVAFILICLVYNYYRKTILAIACIWPIFDMFGGFGPVTLSPILGIIAFLICLFNGVNLFNRSPFKYFAIPFILCAIVSNYNNESHSPSMIAYISNQAILPIVMWFAIRKEKDVRLFLCCWTVYFIIVCIYGFYEAISGHNEFADWASDKENLILNGYYKNPDFATRFGLRRIQSLMLFRDACGAVSALFWGLLYYIKTNHSYYLEEKWLKNGVNFLLIILPIIVLLTGTRACIAMLIVCVLGMMMRNIRFTYIIVLLLMISVGLYVYDSFLSQLWGSFTATDSVHGSNIELREIQLEAVLKTIKSKVFFGWGFGRWQDYSLWADDIYGAESMWFQLLLKVGFIGTLSFIFLIFPLFVFVFKKKLYYAIILMLAYFVGHTLSSLPGSGLSYIFMFVGMIYRIERNKMRKLELFKIVRK